MKKNISVNIFGTLYPIDEDAYELLLKYNENMRRYYAGREGGDEIVDDIEHRVAELLSELQSNGVQAITIDHVSEIIRRIGEPKDFDSSESNQENQDVDGGNSSSQQNEDGRSTRALFRDPDDKLLGGVISGICHYLGIKDTLIPRLLVVVLLFISFSSLAIIYFVAWILIPEAKTPEDRLRMFGKPVTAQAISEELMKGVNSARGFVQNPSNQERAKGCLSAFLRLLLGIIAIMALLLLLALFISLIFCIGSFIFGVGPFGASDFANMVYHVPSWMMWSLFISILCILLIPFYSIIKWLTKKADTPDMSSSSKLVLFASWLLALLLLLFSAFSIKAEIDKNKKENPQEFITVDSNSMLRKFKMKIISLSGCRSRIHEWAVTPDSDNDNESKVIELVQEDDADKEFLFDIRRTETVSPGKYRVEGFVQSNGTGAVIYATMQVNDSVKKTVYEIPPYNGSNIVAMPTDSMFQLSYFNGINENDTARIARIRNLASDYKWDYACMDVEVEESGDLIIGYSNSPDYSKDINNVTYFKASQLKIHRIEF